MRADRLIATLLLLQSRGRVTAAQVTAELEVSVRTARRDLEALAVSGVPVFSSRGRGGRWSLVGGARTDLTGLTADEARALFLAAGPVDAAPVKAALRKLVQALPAPLRDAAASAQVAVLRDGVAWGRTPVGAPPLLDVLERAVVAGQQVRLAYVDRHGEPSERDLSPLGLVDKGGTWYLVAGTGAGVRTFRVSRVAAVTPLGVAAVRPEGFDLAVAWWPSTSEVEQRRMPTVVVGLAWPQALGVLRARFGHRLTVLATERDGRVRVEVAGPSVRLLALELAGHGASVDSSHPPRSGRCWRRWPPTSPRRTGPGPGSADRSTGRVTSGAPCAAGPGGSSRWWRRRSRGCRPSRRA